ncbi:MAG: alpha-amylase [Spirulina sp. DLM2.Bin59]|nr:MAG: alpha-amylase [Spirulina sp. DLM2.Bin59]
MTQPNGVMMQYFHWYQPNDGSLWKQVKDRVETLAGLGVTSLWLPPAYKGAGGDADVGYAVYDLFDLGEFDQKGSIRTKYGTKDEYLEAIAAARKAGIRIYADVVLNHRMGADYTEEVKAIPMDPNNRGTAMGDYETIKAWTHFTFPGRQGQYSSLELHWWHFDAIDHNAYDEEKNAIYLFEGKSFDHNVDLEKGNFDYLMGCDLDMSNPDVITELKHWGEWYVNTTGVDGFRFDAVKHINADLFVNWLHGVQEQTQKDLFAVGEYWSGDVESLHYFLGQTDGKLLLFDAPLHYNFHLASIEGESYDMRQIFENTLVKDQPALAVTLVDNHDSQPLQSLESVVEGWFKPLGYALILLRQEGYPCIFYPDYYGAHYQDYGKDGNEYEIWMESHQWLLDKFLNVRKTYAFGDQYDYFDHPNCVGWTRLGTAENPGAIAVVMSNGGDGTKWMEVGIPDAIYVDITEHIKEPITTNAEGWAEFRCNGGSVSLWVPA